MAITLSAPRKNPKHCEDHRQKILNWNHGSYVLDL